MSTVAPYTNRNLNMARPQTIGEGLGNLVRDLGLAKKLREYDVLTSWESIVGAQIASVATPQRLENGVLLVSVASAPWRTELTMRRRELAARINQKAGATVVNEIRFR
jgi:predicted nucleic acid-binding Zn ribbon protein